MVTAVRRVAESYWGSLNLWIESAEGRRGVPTAYSLGPHRYVGLAISQALVRADDRRRFRSMFERAALTGGEAISIEEMEHVISSWVHDGSGTCSNTMRSIWTRSDPEVRARIAEVAIGELESWDGGTRQAVAGIVDQGRTAIRLVCLLRQGLGRSLSLGVVVQGSGDARALEALDPAGTVLSHVDVLSDGAGWLRAADPGALDPMSLIGADVRLRDPATDRTFEHRERALYVFVRDDVTQAYVERDRVALALDTILIVRDRLADATEEVLRAIARPGHMRLGEIRGLPAGFQLFVGVEVLSVPDIDSDPRLMRDLNPLVPIAASQVAIQGGLSLPGLNRKWSSIAPPEVRATTPRDVPLALEARSIRLINDAEGDARAVAAVKGGGAVVLDLRGAALPDGDYEVVLKEGSRETQRRTLRLRSADFPVPDDKTHIVLLGYDLSSPLGPVLAQRRQGDSVVQGPEGPAGGQPINAPMRRARWVSGRRGGVAPTETDAELVVVGVANPSSCAVTGQHRWNLPMVTGAAQVLEGICEGCGLQKRYPANWIELKRARSRGRRRQVAHVHHEIPKWTIAEGATSAVDWSAVMDGVFHLGAGPIRDLERLAAHLDPGAVFLHSFLRTLEATGDIDIARDPGSLEATDWQAAPLSFAGLDEPTWLVVGRRGRRATRAIELLSKRQGGRVEWQAAREGPRLLVLKGLDELAVRRLASSLDNAAIVPFAGRRMAGALPSLSTVLAGLPIGPQPPAKRIERWDSSTARWSAVQRVNRAGGFRFTSHSVRYGLVTKDQVGDHRMRIADTRLARYGGTLEAGDSLVTYEPKGSLLVVPMGAQLPGLYERAIVLSSGHLPQVNEKQGTTVYEGVSVEIAATIAHLLAT